MRTETYTCDECGAVKGESNHWFVADIDGSYFGILRWPPESAESPSGERLHLCGLGCATKAMTKALQRFDGPAKCT